MSNAKEKVKYINDELAYVAFATRLTTESLTNPERSEINNIRVAKFLFKEVDQVVRNLKQIFATLGN